MYKEAYQDAKTIWDLMSDYERAKNFSFKQENIIELQILSKVQIGTNHMTCNNKDERKILNQGTQSSLLQNNQNRQKLPNKDNN